MLAVTRELKLALIVGFFLVLLVSFLIADHLSASRRVVLDPKIAQQQPPVAPEQFVREPSQAPVFTLTQGMKGSNSALGANGDQSLTNQSIHTDSSHTDTSVIAEVGNRVGEILKGNTPLPPAANTGSIPLSGLSTLTMSQNQTTGIDTLGAKGAAEPNDTVADALFNSTPGKLLAGKPSTIPRGSSAVKPFAPVTVARSQNGSMAPSDGTIGSPIVQKLTPDVTQPMLTSSGSPASKADEDRWHTVASGDTAMKIAKRYYNDSNAWRELAKYNGDRMGKNGELRVGVRVRIPAGEKLGIKTKSPTAPTPTPAQPAKQAAPKTLPMSTPGESRLTGADDLKTPVKADIKPVGQNGRTYTVKSGDTMSEIAMNQLGTMKRADEIVKLNGLKTGSGLKVGMTLKLPAK